MKTFPSILVATVLAWSVGATVWVTPVQGDTIEYNFTGFSRNPVSVPPGVAASRFEFNGLAIVTSGAGNPSPSGGPFDNFGLPGTNYTYFPVTPDAGKALDLLSFSFDERNPSHFGPTRWDVFTSVDKFATSLGGAPLDPSTAVFSTHTLSLSAIEFQNLVDPFTIQISGSGGPGIGLRGAWLLDNLTLTFDVADAPPIPEPDPPSGGVVGGVHAPEPATLMLLSTGLLGLLAPMSLRRLRRGSRPCRCGDAAARV